MSPSVQLVPLSRPFLRPQVQVGVRETRLYDPCSGASLRVLFAAFTLSANSHFGREVSANFS